MTSKTPLRGGRGARGGGGQGPRNGRSEGMFKLTSKESRGFNPPNPLDPPLYFTAKCILSVYESSTS